MRLLLLALFFPLAASAQNTGKLSGRVVDGLGDPLPGANVIIEGTQLGASTDIDGNYFVIGIPIGIYEVSASFIGAEPQTYTVTIVSGYTTEQNFEIDFPSLNDDGTPCIPDSSYRPEDLSWQEKTMPPLYDVAEAYGLDPLHEQKSGPREARLWFLGWWPPWRFIRMVETHDRFESEVGAGWPLFYRYYGPSEERAESLRYNREHGAAWCDSLRVGPRGEACKALLAAEPDWPAIFHELEEVDLWTLPDETVLPNPLENCGVLSMRLDGWTLVVEVFDGSTYRAYNYWSPDADSAWPEERRAARIGDVWFDLLKRFPAPD